MPDPHESTGNPTNLAHRRSGPGGVERHRHRVRPWRNDAARRPRAPGHRLTAGPGRASGHHGLHVETRRLPHGSYDDDRHRHRPRARSPLYAAGGLRRSAGVMALLSMGSAIATAGRAGRWLQDEDNSEASHASRLGASPVRSSPPQGCRCSAGCRSGAVRQVRSSTPASRHDQNRAWAGASVDLRSGRCAAGGPRPPRPRRWIRGGPVGETLPGVPWIAPVSARACGRDRGAADPTGALRIGLIDWDTLHGLAAIGPSIRIGMATILRLRRAAADGPVRPSGPSPGRSAPALPPVPATAFADPWTEGGQSAAMLSPRSITLLPAEAWPRPFSRRS